MVNGISWDTNCCDRRLTEVHQHWFHQLQESSGPLYHSSADVCVLCVVGKKPTSRRKVVDRTPVHDVKSLVTHFTTSPPEVSGSSSLFDSSQGSAASPVLRYSLIINLLQI